MRRPVESAPMYEHLEGVLADTGVRGLLRGDETALFGRDVP